MRFALATLAAITVATMTDAKPRPMTIDDLFQFKRLSDPQISPDGKYVVYQVGSVDFDANKSSTALYLAAVDGKTPPKQLTAPIGKKDSHPRFSPDGKQILFESNRAGTSQLFVISLDGGEARQLTSIKTGANTAIYSPDGKSIAFVSTVYPEFSKLPFAESDAKNAAKDEEREKSPVKVKVFTRLFYRHWDQYTEEKRHHLFVCDAEGKGVRDVTPGDRDAYPNSSTFSVGDDFTFTPDSKNLVFAAAPAEKESWSTNYDLCRVAIDNTSDEWETLTGENKAADNGPAFSPDGKKLAWRAQKKAGYEADKWDILSIPVKPDGSFDGDYKNLTTEKDVSANGFAWAGSDRIVFTADANGSGVAFTVNLRGDIAEGIALPASTPRNSGPAAVGSISSITITAKADVASYARAALSHPAELGFIDTRVGGKSGMIASGNEELLKQLELPRPESVKVDVEDGEMQMWILKPPNYSKSKKYPLVYMIHGGPQGAWEDAWSYRWNPEVWAAQGYVIALPNPRGSTGFGQKFVDQISGDWGGKCYRDLEAGLTYLEKLDYVDKNRIASAGASFGGYMQDWFAVNPIAEKLKCQISHCSVFNFESMWGTTDELWFDEYEHGGLPWEVPGKYAEFSPHKKAANLGKYQVPMLVIHNDYDFRCPIGQGHELFQSLQRQGVPSRFVNFPDEGHWVLKPQNSKRWHEECFAWLAKYVPVGGK